MVPSTNQRITTQQAETSCALRCIPHLWLPLLYMALRLFLTSPNGTINIHGFGSIAYIANGLAHCCTSKATVVEIGEAGVFLRLFQDHASWSSQKHIFIPNFNYLGTKSSRRKVSFNRLFDHTLKCNVSLPASLN